MWETKDGELRLALVVWQANKCLEVDWCLRPERIIGWVRLA